MMGLADPIDLSVDPTLLIAGIGVLAVAMLLFTGRKAAGVIRKHRSGRLRRRRKKLQAQIAALEAA
jgi:hypothetical protein